METWTIAILLRPIGFFILFVLVIAPISWLLYKIIPAGKLKVFLFKDRSGEQATRRDKVIMSVGVILTYVLFGLALFFGFK